MTRLEIAVRIVERADAFPRQLSREGYEDLVKAVRAPLVGADGTPEPLVLSAWAWRVAGDLLALAVDADKQEAAKR